MNITQKHRYGLSAMVILGRYYDRGQVQLRIVAKEASIPLSFLEQLILDLKKVGLVNSTRGAKGGYQLIKHPSKITLHDIFTAIDPLSCVSSGTDVLSFFWGDLNNYMNDYFKQSLNDLIINLKKKEKVLTYSI